MQPIIIIGSGLAGYTLARELRKLDKATPLLLITRDDGNVYSKPMLSNAFSAGKTPESLVSAPAQKVADDLGLQIVANTAVLSIDRKNKLIETSAGDFPYSKLVLALGADPIKPALAGDAADAIFSINDLSDYTRFRAAITHAKTIAIIGTGLIGCEFANDLASGGFNIHVLGLTTQPLQPLVPTEAGAQLQHALEKMGVIWHMGVTTTAANFRQNGITLSLNDGTALQADVVLSAIGLRPRTVLANAAGIAVNRGIVVDNYLRSSDGNIYALGDCAEISGRVLPFVMPIMYAARALAQTLTGTATAVEFPHMPVAIKTPAYPMVVQPAPMGMKTTWVIKESDDGLQIWQVDHAGVMQGFVLTGTKTKQRTVMLGQLEKH